MRTGSKIPKRRRGRPAMPVAETKRFPLSLRTTKALKDKIEAASATFGRSFAQEVEHRLEQSFDLDAALGGPDAAMFFRSLAALAIVASNGRPWITDFTNFNRVADCLRAALSAATPLPPAPEAQQRLLDAYRDCLAELRQRPGDFPVLDMRWSIARMLTVDPSIPPALAQEAAEIIAAKERSTDERPAGESAA